MKNLFPCLVILVGLPSFSATTLASVLNCTIRDQKLSQEVGTLKNVEIPTGEFYSENLLSDYHGNTVDVAVADGGIVLTINDLEEDPEALLEVSAGNRVLMSFHGRTEGAPDFILDCRLN